jgi:hypothetical protein
MAGYRIPYFETLTRIIFRSYRRDDIFFSEMNHVAMPTLKRPDGMFEIPDPLAQFDTVQEGEIPSRHGVQETGVSLSFNSPDRL